jgi:hypothetical protein
VSSPSKGRYQSLANKFNSEDGDPKVNGTNITDNKFRSSTAAKEYHTKASEKGGTIIVSNFKLNRNSLHKDSAIKERNVDTSSKNVKKLQYTEKAISFQN